MGNNLNPRETDAVIAAWAAIEVYNQNGLNEHLAEYDPKAVEQMRAAQAELFAVLDPQSQLCLLQR